MNNIIYIWLSQCVKIDYLSYISLCKIFIDIYELYNLSKNKDKFFKRIRRSKIYINYNIYSKLIDCNLKKKAEQIYSYIKKEKIKILSIDSKNYPKKLKNVFNPPISLFIYGDLSILSSKKVIIYSSYDNSLLYNEVCKYIFKEKISIVDYKLNEFTNILYLPYMQKIDREGLIIMSPNIYKEKCISYEHIAGISDLLIVAKSNYNIKIGIIVDLILEQGKEILTFPGDIYDKEAYYSNYLIKNGSACITDISEIKDYIK